MSDLRPETGHRVLAALAVAAALPLAGARGAEPRRVVMSRLAPSYVERAPEAKAELLAVINAERRAHGAPPLAYDLLGAKVGDEFCDDAARNRTTGHWDLAGRAPYLRWALAGGIDHHAQNFAAERRTGFEFTEPAAELLKKAHAAFMAETPPDDGHRRTVLDPIWTHVGIGFAIVGGEMRMTEEYSRRVLEWAELPAGPVKAGKGAFVAMKLPRGWSVGAIEVAWESFPRPLSRAAIAARGSYGLPPAARTLYPYPPAGASWESGEKGSFSGASGGRVEVAVPLDRGPGHYFLVVFGAEGAAHGKKLYPVAAPMVTAEQDLRHVLVSSANEALVEGLRTLLPPATVLLSAQGVDDTLERLARSARVDAVVTDDAAVPAAIRDELPGSLPVVLLPAGTPPEEALRLLDDALPAA